MLDISEVEVDEEGLQWIATHIHTFMAVGAPFLGAPKIVRGVVLLLLSRPTLRVLQQQNTLSL